MSPTPTSRAIAYRRVSTQEQASSGLGLEAQSHAIAAFAKRQGLTVVATFNDENGVSGSAPIDKRPGLLGAINALQPGDVLLVAKLDRLSRGDAVEGAVIEQLVARRRASIRSASGEGTADDDPSSVLMRRIVAAIGAYERAIIAARTRAALAAKRARGERVGTLPYGQDETERAIVALIHQCRAEGRSLVATAAELNTQGYVTRRGTAWRPQYVRSVLLTIAGTRANKPTASRQERATRAALAALQRG